MSKKRASLFFETNAITHFLHYTHIDSTNAEAYRYCQMQGPLPVWILADLQTAGRGRHGRVWVSEKGNFYGTFVFQPHIQTEQASQLGFVAALAVRDTVLDLCPALRPVLKWPNDLLLGGGKFCGILAEVVDMAAPTIALGMGINLAHVPEGTAYRVCKLGAQITPEMVFPLLDLRLQAWLKVWDEGRGFHAIKEAWSCHALGLGQILTVDGVDGKFAGLSDDGALLMQRQIDNRIVKIYAGDVRYAIGGPIGEANL